MSEDRPRVKMLEGAGFERDLPDGRKVTLVKGKDDAGDTLWGLIFLNGEHETSFALSGDAMQALLRLHHAHCRHDLKQIAVSEWVAVTIPNPAETPDA